MIIETKNNKIMREYEAGKMIESRDLLKHYRDANNNNYISQAQDSC